MARLLVSVFEKAGLVEALRPFLDAGHSVLGSAGTVRTLSEAGLAAEDVAGLVGGGPILGHRVVTLSREVHAGLLARPEDQAELDELGIPRIDMLYVTFYPLAGALADPSRTLDSVFEMMDIGGPTMVKSGIKGKRIVVVDPADLPKALRLLAGDDETPDQTFAWLWHKALAAVVDYYGKLVPFLYHLGNPLEDGGA